MSWERVLCGDGLHELHLFLGEAGIPEPEWVAERLRHGDRNATIADLGLSGESPRCRAALDLFCTLLGAQAGNLALTFFATGGVVVGGGIAPKILPAIERGGFVAAMADKGRLSGWAKAVPVSVALDPRAPLVGAARLLLAGTRAPGGVE